MPQDITENNIEELLIRPALNDLLIKDHKLLEKKLKEECINHRLAFYFETHLRSIKTSVPVDVDVEYDKKIDVKKKMTVDGKDFIARPDILIHKRFSNEGSLLAIEAKKRSILLKDEQKMRGFLDYDYNYKFGLLITYGMPNVDYIRYVLMHKINRPHPPIYRKIVFFYRSNKVRIKSDWEIFVPRNGSISHNVHKLNNIVVL